MFVWIYTHVRTSMNMCAHACAAQEPASGFIFQELSILFFFFKYRISL